MMFVITEAPSTSTSISIYLYSFYSSYSAYFVVSHNYFTEVLSYLNNTFYFNVSIPLQMSNSIVPTYLYQLTDVFYIFVYQPVSFVFFISLFSLNIIMMYLNINITRIEKELNNIEDNIIFLILFILFFFYILGFYLYIHSNMYIVFYMFLYTIWLFVFLIICIPFSLLFTYGFFLPYYLRGASNITFFFYEICLDYINIVSFFLRIGVQFIRVFLILLTIYTYNELYLELSIVDVSYSLVDSSSNF